MTVVINALNWLYHNWTLILIIIAVVIVIYKKTKKFIANISNGKLEQTKTEISQIMLHLVAEAEKKYSDMVQSGAIKRSYVIKELYSRYPILESIADQDVIIEWIDGVIDEALVTLRKVISNTEKLEAE